MGKGNRSAQNVSTKAFRDGHDYIDWSDMPDYLKRSGMKWARCPKCNGKLMRGFSFLKRFDKDSKVKTYCACGYIQHE